MLRNSQIVIGSPGIAVSTVMLTQKKTPPTQTDDPMARPANTWTYDYATLSKLFGIKEDTIRTTASRGQFDPSSLESCMLFAAANGSDDFKLKIICAAARMGQFSAPKPPRGTRKKTKPVK